MDGGIVDSLLAIPRSEVEFFPSTEKCTCSRVPHAAPYLTFNRRSLKLQLTNLDSSQIWYTFLIWLKWSIKGISDRSVLNKNNKKWNKWSLPYKCHTKTKLSLLFILLTYYSHTIVLFPYNFSTYVYVIHTTYKMYVM